MRPQPLRACRRRLAPGEARVTIPRAWGRHTLAAGVAVAGYLKEAPRYAGKEIVIVLCGANIGRERLREVL